MMSAGIESRIFSDERQDRILGIVRQTGAASIDELAARFEVTPQTIRRTVNRLCETGLLRRVHGGVALPVPTQNIAYERRQILNPAAKRLIGEAVAHFIPPSASLFIGLGTTPEFVAHALAGRRDLKVFTNSLNVAAALTRNPEIEITLAGGTYRLHDRDIIGEAAAAFYAKFKADFAIFGVGGLDEDGMLLDFNEGEVEARRAMVESCRSAILVADASKFGRSATVRGGNLRDLDHLFTDQAIPAAFAPVVAESGIRVHALSASMERAA